LAILTLASVPSWSPLPVRLALRDLARYQTRSAAALAAISLALGIPLAVVIGVSAAESAAEEGNLSSRQLLITADDLTAPFVTERTESEHEVLDNDVDKLASELAADSVVELHKVVDPAREVNEFGRPTLRISRPDEERDGATVFAATDELLLLLLDLDRIEPAVELITSEPGGFSYAGATDPVTGERGPQEVASVVTVEPRYSSLPTVIMTADGLERRGWEARPAGWLIHTPDPLTDGQIATARERAISAGITVETRDQQRGLLRLRSGATVVGVMLALGVLAMTVGLVRSESNQDLQTLTATGATSGTRRALTAATAAVLALLGVFLGAVGAYLGLVAGFIDDAAALTPIPLLHLSAIILGVPVAAALAGWLAAGREPEVIARQPIG
jgi:putative ABC transport system permease protein